MVDRTDDQATRSQHEPSSLPIRPIDNPDWNALISTDPTATAFHHPAWAATLSDCYGFRTFLVTVEEDGRLLAGLPVAEVRNVRRRRRWVALPFTDRCQPLGGDVAVRRLVDELQRVPSDVRHVEVRAPVLDGGTESAPFVRHLLPLERDAGAVEGRYRGGTRSAVRQARRSPLRARIGVSEDDLATVYYRLHVATRRRLGQPPQPRSFFRFLWRRMAEQRLCRLVLIELDDRVVAGGLFLTFKDELIYKYGASDPQFWSLRPNNLLFDEIIQWGCENGYRRLDFGRTELGTESLRRFKSSWGAAEESLHYSYIGAQSPLPPRESPRFVRAALRRAPTWAVRLTGELMYRYAA